MSFVELKKKDEIIETRYGYLKAEKGIYDQCSHFEVVTYSAHYDHDYWKLYKYYFNISIEDFNGRTVFTFKSPESPSHIIDKVDVFYSIFKRQTPLILVFTRKDKVKRYFKYTELVRLNYIYGSLNDGPINDTNFRNELIKENNNINKQITLKKQPTDKNISTEKHDIGIPKKFLRVTLTPRISRYNQGSFEISADRLFGLKPTIDLENKIDFSYLSGFLEQKYNAIRVYYSLDSVALLLELITDCNIKHHFRRKDRNGYYWIKEDIIYNNDINLVTKLDEINRDYQKRVCYLLDNSNNSKYNSDIVKIEQDRTASYTITKHTIKLSSVVSTYLFYKEKEITIVDNSSISKGIGKIEQTELRNSNFTEISTYFLDSKPGNHLLLKLTRGSKFLYLYRFDKDGTKWRQIVKDLLGSKSDLSTHLTNPLNIKNLLEQIDYMLNTSVSVNILKKNEQYQLSSTRPSSTTKVNVKKETSLECDLFYYYTHTVSGKNTFILSSIICASSRYTINIDSPEIRIVNSIDVFYCRYNETHPVLLRITTPEYGQKYFKDVKNVSENSRKSSKLIEVKIDQLFETLIQENNMLHNTLTYQIDKTNLTHNTTAYGYLRGINLFKESKTGFIIYTHKSISRQSKNGYILQNQNLLIGRGNRQDLSTLNIHNANYQDIKVYCLNHNTNIQLLIKLSKSPSSHLVYVLKKDKTGLYWSQESIIDFSDLEIKYKLDAIYYNIKSSIIIEIDRPLPTNTRTNYDYTMRLIENTPGSNGIPNTTEYSMGQPVIPQKKIKMSNTNINQNQFDTYFRCQIHDISQIDYLTGGSGKTHKDDIGGLRLFIKNCLILNSYSELHFYASKENTVNQKHREFFFYNSGLDVSTNSSKDKIYVYFYGQKGKGDPRPLILSYLGKSYGPYDISQYYNSWSRLDISYTHQHNFDNPKLLNTLRSILYLMNQVHLEKFISSSSSNSTQYTTHEFYNEKKIEIFINIKFEDMNCYRKYLHTSNKNFVLGEISHKKRKLFDDYESFNTLTGQKNKFPDLVCVYYYLYDSKHDYPLLIVLEFGHLKSTDKIYFKLGNKDINNKIWTKIDGNGLEKGFIDRVKNLEHEIKELERKGRADFLVTQQQKEFEQQLEEKKKDLFSELENKLNEIKNNLRIEFKEIEENLIMSSERCNNNSIAVIAGSSAGSLVGLGTIGGFVFFLFKKVFTVSVL